MTEHSPFHFPDLVDSTIRGDWVNCKKKVEYSFFRNIAGKHPSIHLHAGGAFAFALEATRRAYYERSESVDESLRQGLQALLKFYGPVQLPAARTGDKSCDNVVRAFDSYFARYPLATDMLKPLILPNGQAMVEFSFAIPMQITHPETGNPILYGGRADMIAKYNDTLFVTDEKTATQLGETWASQFDLDSQFTGYTKAAQVYGYPVAGTCVRGVGLLKTKITHAETFVYRSQWEIDRWWGQLHEDVEEMVERWKKNKFGMALHKSVCAAYGGCQFKQLCLSRDPEEWIPLHFRRRVWSPLEKDSGEKLLENTEFMAQATAPELSLPDLNS